MLSLVQWHDFLAAAAGIAGALAGLVFVGLSLNLSRILAFKDLPGRAGETIIQLAGVLVAALLVLIPVTSMTTLGWPLLVISIVTWTVPTRLQLLSFVRRTYYRRWFALWRLIAHQVAILPLVIAAALMLTARPAAMYWLAAALLLTMIAALMNAWVLLVEIVR